MASPSDAADPGHASDPFRVPDTFARGGGPVAGNSKGNTTRCAGLKSAARRRRQSDPRTRRHTRQAVQSSETGPPAHVRRFNELSPGGRRSICKKFASD